MPIRRLDPILIDRIAAGEVVERPAAALKELIENAIDAEARRIDIVLADGGRSLIRVIDDGSGMSRDDLELAIERHATSKLPGGDLDRILTLGFRGEALPSIASVARLSIATRPDEAQSGWQIAVDAGRREAPRPAAQAKGTRIEVRDLFYATPARLKFLRSDRAEAQAAVQIVKRLAMAHPEIRFSMQGEGFTALDYPSEARSETGLIRRLAHILGAAFKDNAVPIDAMREGVRLFGFAGLPTFHRASALDQYLFVNGRPVKDKVLNGALRAAYMDVMSAGRHSVVALFLECEPHFVDVNVHPAKSEVRFRDPGLVRGLIIGALREALASAGHRASSLGGENTLAAFKPGNAIFSHAGENRASQPIRNWRQSPPAMGGSQTTGFAEAARPGFEPMLEPSAALQAAEMDAPTADHLDRPLGAARAQLHETYILAQTRDGFILVDQHAAHERLVYERLKRQRDAAAVSSQIMLIPEIVEIEDGLAQRFAEFAPHLASLGLVLEPFGPGAVAIREAPAAIAHADVAGMVRDLAETMDEWGGAQSLESRIDHVLKTFACHHSVRAGRVLKGEEMNALLREMEATPGSGQCNHGRPTYVEIKLSDIERLFGRR